MIRSDVEELLELIGEFESGQKPAANLSIELKDSSLSALSTSRGLMQFQLRLPNTCRLADPSTSIGTRF